MLERLRAASGGTDGHYFRGKGNIHIAKIWRIENHIRAQSGRGSASIQIARRDRLRHCSDDVVRFREKINRAGAAERSNWIGLRRATNGANQVSGTIMQKIPNAQRWLMNDIHGTGRNGVH